MCYVYVLFSEKTGDLYKGSCEDLKKRYSEHTKGLVKSTKSAKPWKLVYYETFVSKRDALIEEKFLKTGKGRDRLKYVLGNTLNLSGGVA